MCDLCITEELLTVLCNKTTSTKNLVLFIFDNGEQRVVLTEIEVRESIYGNSTASSEDGQVVQGKMHYRRG